MTIEDLYNEILERNTGSFNNGWINPRLFYASADFRDNYFSIKVDAFVEIMSTARVEVYNVSLRFDEKVIHCHRRV